MSLFITLVITGWFPKLEKKKKRIKAVKNEEHLGREAERSHFLLPSPCIYDLSLVECKVPATIGPVVLRKPL